VDHEVEGALKAGALEISPFELMRDRERLLATSLELTLGLRGYLHAPGAAETTSVVTKPALLLKRSQMITLSTRESLVLSSRLRAHANGRRSNGRTSSCTVSISACWSLAFVAR